MHLAASERRHTVVEEAIRALASVDSLKHRLQLRRDKLENPHVFLACLSRIIAGSIADKVDADLAAISKNHRFGGATRNPQPRGQ